MSKKSNTRAFFWLLLLTIIAAYIAFPTRLAVDTKIINKKIQFVINKPPIDFYFWGKHVYKDFGAGRRFMTKCDNVFRYSHYYKT